MGSDFYFYEQCDTRIVPKRYRKLPQELPESLRFAHLNPKVAALLASKERGQRLDNEDPFGDGMGKKSLLPDINASFTNIRNQFDSAMSNDEDSQRYLFEEAKLSAAQVLQQLSRIIYFYENLYEHIPRSLEYHFMSGYEEFTKDIVVVPREWQTHEMKAQYANKVQQQEAISEEEMSENELTGRSRSRLQSERSSEVGSKMNVRRSKQKLGSILDVTEGLEPGLDSRLGKRSESRISLAPSQLNRNLDVGSMSRVGSRRKGSSISSHRSISGQSRRYRDDISLIGETPSEARSTAMANPLSYMQTINFQLSNKSFEDKGWIMLKGRQEEVDQNTVLEYCITRLQECMKDIANQRQKNLDQGYDKSVTVRYYGDSRKETLLKYRKTPVKTSSSLTIPKGGKPRIPSIIDECSEGRLLMQASHIDGSTVIYYPSGRPAVVYSAAGFGRPGYYTIVYEDELDSKMLGCFTPSGRGVCYYANGVVRFLATEKGGHLTEENGKLIRKWKWPHTNVKITEPICFQINNHLMFRCVGQNQMIIVFSSQKETARFSVGPAPEADEYRPIEETDQLLTAFTFSSKAAKDLMRIFAPKKQKKRSRKKKKKKKGKEELEKKDSDGLKQVQFSDEMVKVAPVQKLATRFRRSSFSPGGETRQNKTQPNTFRTVSNVFSFCRSDRKDQSANTECKHRTDKKLSVTPDLLTKSSLSKKQSQDLTKRPKSARQVPTIDSKEALRGKRLSSTNVITCKSSAMDKHIKMEASEDMSKQTSHVHMTSGSDNKSPQTSSDTKANLKIPPSILKNSKSRKLDVNTNDKSDHKEVRVCKSATGKLKSSSLLRDVDKRVQSATTSAVLSTENSETDRHVRHKSLATAHLKEKDSEILPSTDSGLNGFDQDTAALKEARNVFNKEFPKNDTDDVDGISDSIILSVPVIMVTDHGGDIVEQQTVVEDEEKTDTGDEEKTDTCDDEKADICEEEKISSADGDTGEENKESEEDDLMPENVIYRRQRGGCQPLIFNDDDEEEEEVEEETCTEEENKEEAEEVADVMPDDVTFRRKRGNSSQPISDEPIGVNKTKDDDELDKTDKKDAPEGYVPKRHNRRKSSLMQSIMLFRKKVLAKKGIFEPSSSETSDSDSDSDDSQTSKSQSSEIIKLLQDFPDKVSYDIEAEKELVRLQRKARNLIDDWMEHYRIALGFKSPLLQSVDDMPTRRSASRNIKSAKASNHLLMIRKAVLGLDFEEDGEHSPRKKNRIPSAPLKGEVGDELDEELQQLIADKQQTVKFDESGQAGDGSLSPSALTTINRLTDNASRRSTRSKVSSARSGSPARPSPALPSERVPSAASGNRSFCPLVIRQQRLNYERPQCRCSRHHIPFIMDVELDDFIGMEAQEGQMVVIMIVSSLKNIKNKVTNVDYDFYINKEGVPFHRVFPGITKAEEMLNEIYVNQNRNRTRPCVQSRMDVFRIFKYDINSAAEMSNHTTPLLMTRHNVVPGMFLIYCDGKLLFCDHIFNGYGNARKDFKKQVMKCRHDSIQGFYLPKDFRFSPSKGKSGLRSAWGGEIGGAGVDKYSSSGTVVDKSLQPIHRPTSSPNSSENSQPLPYDSVKSTNRRPFLPRIDANQAGPSQIYHSESINNWLSNGQPGGQTSSFSTTNSYTNSLSETY